MEHILYLASGSPRRREILEKLGYRIIRLASEIDETPKEGENADDYVRRMAREKNASAVAAWAAQNAGEPDFPILTADTSVALDNRILGKPETRSQAEAMLRALSGKKHQVMTAVCVFFKGQTVSVLQTSDVRFKTLSEQEVSAYVATGEPMDKAGAYGIQGLGGMFVADLSGSFTGVMGLPVYETVELFKCAGVAVPPFAE